MTRNNFCPHTKAMHTAARHHYVYY